MGLLDRILNRPQKPKQDVLATAGTEQGQPKLDLTKKMGLTFEKLNLDKEDVRNKKIFVLDVSGSMGERFGDGQTRKIDSLIEIMSKYRDSNMICFSSNVTKISNSSEIPYPNGSTNLASALRYISEKITPLPEGLVLVSDGEPDNETKALKEAKTLSLPIDIIYIGNKGDKGEKFMETLARETGGQHFVL